METLHLAVSIIDRYLAALGTSPAPNLLHLATAAILMGAKLEQPISPSFNRMISLLPESQRGQITKQDLVNLEHKILCTL